MKNKKFYYSYEIYNKKGKLVKKEDVQQQGPRIEYVSDKLLSIGLVAGSYVISTQYYDIENDVFSEIYETPLAVHENMVVYVDETKKLIVRDIFDSSKYYKEFKLNFADSAVPVSLINKVKFIEDKKLQVTYLSGKKYKEVTEYLVLK